MDIDRVLARVRNILLDPHGEWPAVAAERSSVGEILNPYVMLLAAIPAVAGFLRSTVIGFQIPFSGRVRMGLFPGLRWAIVGWLVSMLAIWLFALVIDALAPSFGGTKDRVQAMKTAAYAHTAVWVAGLAYLLPWLGIPITIAGGLWGVYLLFTGLPHTMKCPPERAVGYTIATLLIGALLSVLLGRLTHGVGGLWPRRPRIERPRIDAHAPENLPGSTIPRPYGPGSGAPGGAPVPGAATVPTLPPGTSPLRPGPAVPDEGRPPGTVLDDFQRRMEAATRKMEQARQSGDPAAQRDAVGDALGTLLGGGTRVEALSPEQLRAFVPTALGGLPRTKVDVERNGALGMQVSTARATYGDGDQRLELEVTDMGSVRGLMALAEWASVLHERETDDSWDRTRKVDGRIVHEKWDAPSRSGEYGVVLGERFAVKVSGNVKQVATLQAAMRGMDLEGLEALRDSGVKK